MANTYDYRKADFPCTPSAPMFELRGTSQDRIENISKKMLKIKIGYRLFHTFLCSALKKP